MRSNSASGDSQYSFGDMPLLFSKILVGDRIIATIFSYRVAEFLWRLSKWVMNL